MGREGGREKGEGEGERERERESSQDLGLPPGRMAAQCSHASVRERRVGGGGTG
jgi:hypothetical protein